MKQAFIFEIPPKDIGDGMFHHRKIVPNLIRMHGTRNDRSHQGMAKRKLQCCRFQWDLMFTADLLDGFYPVQDCVLHRSIPVVPVARIPEA